MSTSKMFGFYAERALDWFFDVDNKLYSEYMFDK